MCRGDATRKERLVAYVVPGELANEVSVSEWRQQLEERLPQYMVPAVFMVIDKMPLTSTGKVARRALPEVDESHAELRSEYVDARTETEKTLAGIWTEVLPVERVGIHDNFFELGGHSLLATRMVSLRAREIERGAGTAQCSLSRRRWRDWRLVDEKMNRRAGPALPPIERVERGAHCHSRLRSNVCGFWTNSSRRVPLTTSLTVFS